MFITEADEKAVDEKSQQKAPEKKPGKTSKAAEQPSKQAYRKSTPSIKEALSKREAGESKDAEKNPEQQRDLILKGSSQAVFTQEELTRAWDAFAESIKTEYPRMYSAIKNNAPDYKEDFKLNFSLNNKGQEEDFTVRIKPILLNYLRKELNNYTIDIVVNFAQDENAENKNMFYTAEDKFKYLSEKNPLLAKLKQQFNLDFE